MLLSARQYRIGTRLYLSVSEEERGTSLGIDGETYRELARTALAIIKDLRLTMGLYRMENGCGLDIFGKSDCLTIVVDSAENQLSLLSSPMDSGGGVFCLMTVDNSENGWRRLLKIAREEIKT
jgi:hypothetical protein